MRRGVAAVPRLRSARCFLGGLFGQSKDGADAKNFMDPQKLQDMMRNMTPEQRREAMRRAIEVQKRLASMPGMGGLLKGNVAMLEKLLQQMEQGTPSESASSIATPKAGGGSNPTSPTLDELRKVSLGPEIDALFNELASMRAKRNEYRAKFEEAEEQNKLLQRSLADQTSAAAELRDRLRVSEKTVSLLNTEVASLTEKSAATKSLQTQLNEARGKLSAERMERTTEEQLKQQVSSSQANVAFLTKANEALTRRIERVQHRDPTLRVSLLLSDIRRAGGDNVDFSAVDNALAQLQDSFSGAVSDVWKSGSHQKASMDVVFAAAQAFISAALPCSNFDALVEYTSEREFAAATDGCNVIIDHPSDGMSTANVVRGGSGEPPLLGPFGVVFALHAARLGSVTSVRPFISGPLFDNPRRVSLEETYTRSSKPGGQAANTAETQCNVSLSLDGKFLFGAEAQDTRKALENRQLAKERLKSVELPKFNRRIGRERYSVSVADRGPFQWIRGLLELPPQEHPYAQAVIALLQRSMSGPENIVG